MVTIKVSKDSELSQRIQAAMDSGEPLYVDNGEQIIRLEPSNITIAPEDDIWAGYDPELVRESIRRTAGAWKDSGIDAEAMKAAIYRAREEGTRPEPDS